MLVQALRSCFYVEHFKHNFHTWKQFKWFSHRSVCPSAGLSVCLSVCLSVRPSVRPSVCLSVSVSVCLAYARSAPIWPCSSVGWTTVNSDLLRRSWVRYQNFSLTPCGSSFLSRATIQKVSFWIFMQHSQLIAEKDRGQTKKRSEKYRKGNLLNYLSFSLARTVCMDN